MTVAATANSLSFNMTTNGNLRSCWPNGMHSIVQDPPRSACCWPRSMRWRRWAQVVVGRLIDRISLKRLYLGIMVAQVPLFALAAQAQGLGGSTSRSPA